MSTLRNVPSRCRFADRGAGPSRRGVAFGRIASVHHFLAVQAHPGRVLLVFVVLPHHRPRIVHVNVTDHPTALYGGQMIKAFPNDRERLPTWSSISSLRSSKPRRVSSGVVPSAVAVCECYSKRGGVMKVLFTGIFVMAVCLSAAGEEGVHSSFVGRGRDS